MTLNDLEHSCKCANGLVSQNRLFLAHDRMMLRGILSDYLTHFIVSTKTTVEQCFTTMQNSENLTSLARRGLLILFD